MIDDDTQEVTNADLLGFTAALITVSLFATIGSALVGSFVNTFIFSLLTCAVSALHYDVANRGAYAYE